MRVAVAGGTGVVGQHVVRVLNELGHTPVVLARSAGVDLVTGAGLAAALTGAEAVIDVATIRTRSAEKSESFFRAVTTALLRHGLAAGVSHYVALSIVGIDRAPLGYYAGKVLQEALMRKGALPWTVLGAALARPHTEHARRLPILVRQTADTRRRCPVRQLYYARRSRAGSARAAGAVTRAVRAPRGGRLCATSFVNGAPAPMLASTLGRRMIVDASGKPMTQVEADLSPGTFEEAQRRSVVLRADFSKNPGKYRVLTGDRPTGALHVGHYFGSLKNRVELQALGVETFVVIADYQVLTDRESVAAIPDNVRELVLDYLSVGLDPSARTHIFCHSQVPSLNQLLVPFLTLVGMGELDRNPTVKEEIDAAGLTNVNAAMYTYPVHQAADILFCKGNIVPVGRDQLPHLELTRKIARRFNQRYAKTTGPVFPEPEALLSSAPKILGLDGMQKMSKSRDNAVMLRATADETAQLVKKAKTDSERNITYEPSARPEVANLVFLISLCTGEAPDTIASRIGDGGSGALKKAVTEALNETLAPIRARRSELNQDAAAVVQRTLKAGCAEANRIGDQTLREMRRAMNMDYGL